jgi:myo-inositol 2-dehydrogenase/D-chiro-inositol 1-dehydrogenase
MRRLYTVRDREYLQSDRADGWPDSVYDAHARDVPPWVRDVSDLRPSVSAIVNPGREARERAATLCRDHGDDPALYETLEGFLEDGAYDAVVVASPTDRHVDAVVPLLERGIDVLCEKPLANTLPAHDRAIETAADSEGVLYVGFQRRVAPFYGKVASLIEDGVVGRLGTMSHVDVRDPFQPSGGGTSGFRFSQERSGGALLEKNSHDFDLFNWYSGRDPLRVTAFGGQHVFTEGTDVVDQAVVNVEYEDGIVASLELCLYNGVGVRDVYDVRAHSTSAYRGSGGVVRLPGEPGVIEVTGQSVHDRITVDTEGAHGGDVYQVHRFLRCVVDGAEPPASPIEAKKAAAIAIAAERSLRADGTVLEIDSNYDLRE